jgi:hypothetical protein
MGRLLMTSRKQNSISLLVASLLAMPLLWGAAATSAPTPTPLADQSGQSSPSLPTEIDGWADYIMVGALGVIASPALESSE